MASEYLSKGSPLFVEGRLKLDTWEKDGEKKSKLRVICERMQLIGAKAGAGEPRSRTSSSPSAYDDAGMDAGRSGSEQFSSEEHIPF